MSNSLGTINVNVIAQEGLAYLAAQYPIIGQITSDLSNEQAAYGATILSSIPSVGTVQDYDTTNGYVPASATGTDVSVTLNKHKHVSFALNDQELSSSNPEKLVKTYAESFAEGLGQQVMSDIAALFTTGTFTNSTVMALTGCNVQNVINAPNTALNKRNVPKSRFGIFNSDYYGALFNDDQIVNLQKGGNGISASNLPAIHGVELSDYSALPTTSNLVGVVGHKSAVVFTSRVPSDVGYKSAPAVADISIVTDPKSGLSVQVRKFYDPYKGKLQVTYSLMYGVAVADAARAQLIRSA